MLAGSGPFSLGEHIRSLLFPSRSVPKREREAFEMRKSFTKMQARKVCSLVGSLIGFSITHYFCSFFERSVHYQALVLLCILSSCISIILIYRMRGKNNSFLFYLAIIMIFMLSAVLRSSFSFSLLSGMTFAFILQVSSGESGIEREGTLSDEYPSSTESLATFRAEIAPEGEAILFKRIQALAHNLYYLIPPQNHPGEYEEIVREHLGGALSVQDYLRIYDSETFELSVLERKGLLQEELHSLMINDPAIERIMNHVPSKDIRQEVYDFLERKVEPVNPLKHSFQRDIMDGTLNSFLSELSADGRNSRLYREFYSDFIDEEFRRKLGLPLP